MNISSAGVGIVHKNCVGVGIVTKMTGVGIGKVCWNRNRIIEAGITPGLQCTEYSYGTCRLRNA